MLKLLKLQKTFCSSNPLVLNEIKNNVFYCKINNPGSKNALSKAMIIEVQNSINKITTNNDLMAAVFCSNVKGTFCTGANLKVD